MSGRKKSSFKREKAKQNPVITFHFFSEGSKTEVDYFDAYISVININNIKIKFHTVGAEPMTLFKDAKKFADKNNYSTPRSRKKLNSYEEKDEIWIIFDRDQHPYYYNAKQACSGTVVNYAYSDPCFELWINLHCAECDKPCSRHETQKITETLFNDYSSSRNKTTDFSKVICNYEIAESRSELQRNRRVEEGNESGNPSTNVDLLTKAIREAGT